MRSPTHRYAAAVAMFCAALFSIAVEAQQLTGVFSRKTHGLVGTFDIPINYNQPIDGILNIEPRASSAGHRIVFKFDNNPAITSVGSPSVLDSIGNPLGTAPTVTFTGTEVLVDLPPIPNNTRVTVAVNGINGTISKSASLGFLLGDVDESGIVDNADVLLIKSLSARTANSVIFRSDLNATGAVNAADIVAAKESVGLSLPPAQAVLLSVATAGAGAGTITSLPATISCGATCNANFASGTSITLTATPSVGSTFTGWSGGGCTGTGTCGVTLTAATTVTATFTLNTYLLTATKVGTGAGTITSAPAGISCGATCSVTYGHGTSITLTGAAAVGSAFTGWSGGGCSGTGTCVVSLTAATTVTATFTLNTYLLTATKVGTGAGTITSAPAGISCGATCSSTYAHGTSITLTAAPAVGSTFTGWSGGGCTGTGTCVVSLAAATTVTATFALNTYLLTATKAGTGTGTVTSVPAGISCGATCSATYGHGTSITLTAAPAVGSTFAGWSGGGCTGTGTCVVSLTAATTVTATFTLNTYSLTATKAGTGTGTITSAPAGISCGATCSATYGHGTSVTLTAAPAISSNFTGWSGGACSGTGTCVVSLTSATTVTATFTLKTYAVTPSAGANGTISPSTVQAVNHGATTTFTVTPNAGLVATVGGTCGGTLVGTNYTTNPITAACTVSATFGSVSFAVTPSAGANGVITPSTVQTVTSGATKTFTVSPNANYTPSVSGTCGGTLVGLTYTTNPIVAACTVVASFVRNSYSVTPSAGANGTISPTTTQTVLSGATKAFSVTPGSGYSATVGGTCGGTLSGTTFTTSPITGNCAVIATFASTLPKYVSTSGSDTTGDGSIGNPWRTIAKGISTMVSGETLIVRNGTYSGAQNFINLVPSGTSTKYTTIAAETPMLVRIQSTGTLTVADNQLSIPGNYIKVDGFIFDMSGTTNPAFAGVISGNFNTLSRSIFKRGGDIDSSGGLLSVTGSDNLIEDVAGTGACRYCFAQGGLGTTTQRNVWRRVVGRFDYSNATQAKATFATEGGSAVGNVRDHLYQNVIAIDGQNPGNLGGTEKMGGFYASGNTSNITLQGSMVLNEGVGSAGIFMRELGSINNASNSVVWDLRNSLASAPGIVGGNADHLTVGGVVPGVATDLVTSATASLLKPAINPANLLNNTPGAVILKQYGVSGTRWGQVGYDQLTTVDLWPWPYQDRIKSVFAETNNPPAGNSPTLNNSLRGFSANGNGLYGGPITFSSYVWEYLGVACPPAACTVYTVTPSAGANGTISPATPQAAAVGATVTFSVTPNVGFFASVAGTCGGTLTGTTYTTNVINGSCTVVVSFSSNSADTDFAARCAAPGVVLCKGLDGEAQLQAAEMGNAGDGTRQGFIDSTTKTSGGGSLKFTLRAGVASPNIGGFWDTPLGYTFRVGDTIHVQYRFRASPEYFSNNDNYWDSSVKQINIHGPTSTCQGAEYTTIMNPGNRLDMYNNCGDGFRTNVGANDVVSSCPGDCLLQQGASHISSPNGSGYNCRYQNQFAGLGDGDGCFKPSIGFKWYTIYEKIFIGAFGGNTSTVDAYVAVDGGPYKQFHRLTGVYFNNNRDDNFTNLRFETYMTEIARGAPVTAYIWYDELIVSRQPIAPPAN